MNSLKNHQLIQLINSKVISFLRVFSQLISRDSPTRNVNLLLFCLLVMSIQSCLSDIRTNTVKSSGSAETNLNKGKELLSNIHEGQRPSAWENIEVYELTLTDDFLGFMGNIAKPFPDKKQAHRSYMRPARSTAK